MREGVVALEHVGATATGNHASCLRRRGELAPCASLVLLGQFLGGLSGRIGY